MTTPAPEVQERRRNREAGRDFYATQGEQPPTLSPEVVASISAGGPSAGSAAGPSIDPDLSRQFGAAMTPPLRPGQARTSDTGDRRPGQGGTGPAAGKDSRDTGGRG